MERIYVINLRRGFINVSARKRAKRAIKDIKEFVKRHTKCLKVWIDPEVNKVIWKKGGLRPPAKIKVKVEFDENKRDIARVYLAQ